MTEFELCLPCAKLRGHTPYGWQGCAHQPGDDFPGADVSEEAALCVLCVRGLAGGRSRWSKLACSPCMSWEHAVRDRLGRALLPLGRHSIMNGVRVPLDRLPDGAEQLVPALLGQFAGWDRLRRWQGEELARLAETAGLHSETIPYEQWAILFPASIEASRSAYLRLRGVDPSWIVRTFPRLWDPDPTEAQPQPTEVRRPEPGDTVRVSPGPDGHDLIITADQSGCWYTARCGEPGCDWTVGSIHFPLVRRHAKRHATDGLRG
jgi:hypothetical protein